MAGCAERAGLAGAAEAAVAVSAVVQPTATATAARRAVLTEKCMNVPLGDGGPVGRLTSEDAGPRGRVDRVARLLSRSGRAGLAAGGQAGRGVKPGGGRSGRAADGGHAER